MNIRSHAIAAMLLLAATGYAEPIRLASVSASGPGDGGAGQDAILLVDGDIVSGTGEGPGYQWSVYGDTDPLINWSFAATPLPGTDPSVPFVYDLTIPVDPGTYHILINLASVTVSDIGTGGTNPTSVSSITIDGYVPSTTLIPEVALGGGPVVAPNGGTQAAAFGPVSFMQTFTDPGDMRVRLSFLLNSPDFDGSAAFTGQLSLLAIDEVPEPATSALLGMGLIGLAIALRARQRSRESA